MVINSWWHRDNFVKMLKSEDAVGRVADLLRTKYMFWVDGTAILLFQSVKLFKTARYFYRYCATQRKVHGNYLESFELRTSAFRR